MSFLWQFCTPHFRMSPKRKLKIHYTSNVSFLFVTLTGIFYCYSLYSHLSIMYVGDFNILFYNHKPIEFSCGRVNSTEQDIWRQQVTGGKLREIQEEAKGFAIGNKALAALFVHTPAGELQRQIRSWLAENFEFLSVTGDEASGGTTGQLELLSTAIMDGWMAGLGAALPPNTDALGQLLSEYAKRVYNSQLQHLKVCPMDGWTSVQHEWN